MDDCGLLNLASCLPGIFVSYFTNLLNAPLQPLLSWIQSLLMAQVNLESFSDLWIFIIYLLSLFYAFLIIYAGFSFISSGYDSLKRDSAKSWLKNIIIMVILIQASFFIYKLTVEISSILSSITLSLVNNNFFLITADSLGSLGLNLIFITIYFIVLLTTLIFLIIRYGIVAIGVVFFPIALFLYYLHPTKSFGLMLLSFLGSSIFITFIDSLVLVGFSRLLEIDLFSNIKILVMIAAFLINDGIMLAFMLLSITKASSAINIHFIKK